MRALFFGSRSWSDLELVGQAMDELLLDGDGSLVVIHGGARGADLLAQEAARQRGLRPIVEPARWNVHDREGATSVPCRCPVDAKTCRAAGVRRNQAMIDLHHPEVARGFRSDGDSPGTDDMVRRLKAAGVGGMMKRSPLHHAAS